MNNHWIVPPPPSCFVWIGAFKLVDKTEHCLTIGIWINIFSSRKLEDPNSP